MNSFIVGLLIFLSFKAHADRNTGIRAMALANGSLMSSPPLPELGARKGEWSVGIKGAQFTGEKKDGVTYLEEADFEGTGGALLIGNQVGQSWGWYFMVMGNTSKGSFDINANDGAAYQINLSEIKSSLFSAVMGLSYTMLGKTMLPIQVFAGAGISKTNLSQTVKTNHSTSPDDFDMTMEASAPIVMMGGQVGLRLTSWLTVNPYYVITSFANSKDRCQKYKRPETRQTGTLYDFSDPNCQIGQNSSNSEIEYDTAFSAHGVNIIISDLNLSINISSDFEGPKDFDGVDFKMVSASITF